MAWSPVSVGPGGNDSAAGASYILWALASVGAGDRLVLVVATDNIATTDGNTNNHTGVSTTASEVTWSKLYEFTNGQGASAAGATVSIWVSSACPDTSLGQTTVSFSGSITKKAYTTYRFATASGATVSSTGTPQGLANDGSDPGSMTLGSLTNAEHLWVRGVAAESSSTTGLTPTGGWTSFGAATAETTSGGGSAANMAARGEFLIATATTATSDPTLFSADIASALVALDEAGGAAFSPIDDWGMAGFFGL